MLNALIIMVLVIAALITAVVLLIKSNIKIKKEKSVLQSRISKLKENLNQVIDYTETENGIQKSESIIKNNIKDKTDEEKTNIITNVINIFNDSEL
ncbi:MAG: hypothetical protein WBA74_10255 [Cyclobacteriaceae bacterium]